MAHDQQSTARQSEPVPQAVTAVVPSAVPSAVLSGMCAARPFALRAPRLWLRRRLRHLYIRW
jgi:hypothetical protein